MASPIPRRAALAGLGGALAVLTAPTAAHAAAGGVRHLALTGRPLTVSGGAMVGVLFPDGTTAGTVAVRVTRAGSAPGAWLELPVEDGASDPAWTGALGADATVEVDLPAGTTARLAVVDPGVDPGRSTLSAAADGLRPAIRSRAQWGADESLRRGGPDYSRTIRAAIVHHTADGGSYSQAEVPAVIRGMYRYHTQSLGWSDLGYNVVVDRFGGIWEGRAGGLSKPVLGAHAGGFNTDTFGVSMMGDFTSVAPTDATLQSVAAVIAWKFSLHQDDGHDLEARGHATLTSSGGGTSRWPSGRTVTIDAISGHRDVGFTACPGDVGYTRLDDVRARTAALLAGATKSSSSSPIARKYAHLRSQLGAPTSEEGDAARGGRFRHYENGSIYHQPQIGTFAVRGTHLAKYASVGWEWSALGFPTTDSATLPGGEGSFTHFEHGSIYRRFGADPHVVLGAIRSTWAARGWERSALGLPVSDEYDVAGGRASDFEGGRLRWNASTGSVREN